MKRSAEASLGNPRNRKAGYGQIILEELKQGASGLSLQRSLAHSGISLELADRFINRSLAQPHTARALADALSSLRQQNVLELYRNLFVQSGADSSVEKRPSLSPAIFFRDYYYANRPVIVKNWMTAWPALKRWSPRFLRDQFGDVEIAVMTDRQSDSGYAANVSAHTVKTTVREFVNRVLSGGRSNDYYLVGQNLAVQTTRLSKLLKDLRAVPGVTQSMAAQTSTLSIWFGPGGTVTPLHFDAANALFGQIAGRKRFLMIPPFDLPYLYARETCFSAVDALRPDLNSFPLFRKAHVMDLILKPGEMLFIPVGWWHCVVALDVSISVSFKQFRVPNGNTFWNRDAPYLETLLQSRH